jgi:cytochrome c1
MAAPVATRSRASAAPAGASARRADLGARVYLGGRLTNTPGNLIRWIEDPRAVDPQTAMPTTGISKREARDMAAYLLTLR